MIDPVIKKILEDLHNDLAIMAAQIRRIEAKLKDMDPTTVKYGEPITLVCADMPE